MVEALDPKIFSLLALKDTGSHRESVCRGRYKEMGCLPDRRARNIDRDDAMVPEQYFTRGRLAHAAL